jgi:hypothetical protein
MIYRCVHRDSQLGFSVYRGNLRDDLLRDDLVLVATLPGSGQREVAMRLTDPEPILFVHYTNCFPDFVENFVAAWDSPRYQSRLVSVRHQDPETIECFTEPGASPSGGPGTISGNSEAGEGPPSVS